MVLTVQQKTFLVECYFRNGVKVNGIWQYSVPDCFQDFRNEFPEIIMEFKHFQTVVARCLNVFRETGSVLRREGSGHVSKRTPEVVEAVRQVVTDQPKTSIRQLSQQVDLSVGTCHTILHKDLHFYPYRLTAVQELLPADHPRRLQFCRWFLDTFNDEQSLSKVFFTDESWFYLTGYVNSQNMRLWSAENPHEFVQSSLHPEKVGVWAAISARRIIGPIFFEGKQHADTERIRLTRGYYFRYCNGTTISSRNFAAFF